MLDRIDRIEPPVTGGPVGRGPTLRLPPPPPCDPVMMKIRGVAAGWDADGPPVVKDVDLVLEKVPTPLTYSHVSLLAGE